MSFTARLVHRLALVAPTAGDPEDVADLSDYGDAVADAPSTTLVRGLVQPRTAKEIEALSQAGAELSSHVIFLERIEVPQNAYLADADEVGILSGGRRFDVVGVRDFDFGRSPHLEVDVRVVGRSEAPIGS